MPIKSSLRSSDIPVEGGGVTTDGLPLGLEDAGRLKSEPSDPSQLPDELRPLALVFRLVDVRPGGLPRRTGLREDDAPRLVFAYWRGLVLTLFLRC